MDELKSVSHWKHLSRLQRWSIIFSAALLFYTLFGFFILPLILRSQLEKQVAAFSERHTVVREVKFNPYTLELAINGFQVNEKGSEKPFVSFDGLRVNFQAMSLLKRALMVKSFSLVNPYAGIAFNEDGSFNFTDLLQKGGGESGKTSSEPGRPFLFSINNIELKGGRVDFSDRLKKVDHAVSGLLVGLPFLSNLAYDVQIFTQPAFEANVNGTLLKMAGESIPFDASRQTELAVKFAGIDITRYLAYLPDSFNFSIAEGLLDLDLALSFIRHEDGNPAVKISGQTGLRQVKVVDGEGRPLLAFPALTVDIERAHLLRQEFHLRKIYWENPELYLARDKQGALNLAGLVESDNGTEKEKDVDPAGTHLLLNTAEIAVEGATVHFSDLANETDFVTTLHPIDVGIKNFSTEEGKSAEYSLACSTESNEQIKVDGSFTVDPLRVSAGVGVENIRPEKYRPYYASVLQAELGAEKADLRAKIDFVPAEEKILVSGFGAELGGFVMKMPDAAEELVVPIFALKDGSIDVKAKKVTIGHCLSANGAIPLIRRKDGTMNLQDFLRVPADQPPSAKESQDEKGEGWQVLLERLELNDFAVDFIDSTPGTPAHVVLDKIQLTTDNATNEADKKAELALTMRLNKTGELKTEGTLQMTPLDVRLAIDWAELPLVIAQPYIGDYLDLFIGEGRAGLKGTAGYSQADGEKGKFSFQGDLQSRKFACLQGKQADKLLSWKTFRLKKIDVTTNPVRIATGEIFADGPVVKIEVDADGVFNLSKLVKGEKVEPEKTLPQDEKAGEQTDIEIGKVSLVNGSLLFSDRSITPRFDTVVDGIKGQVSGLSSRKDVRAKIDINGRFDGHSPLRLSGSIQPLRDFFTDIAMDLGDFELNRMNPYSIKYIGYPMTKGKLNLNLHYLVNGKDLKSENKVFLDQITLGDFVKNDTAVNVPVQLAISLLKNRAGEIDLNIPVTGRLDDPEFSLVGVVFKVIFNLIVKAATSPFSLMGSLFEGGGDSRSVHFEAGKDVIIADDLALVEKLATMLYDRPGIKVDLVGGVDRAVDTEMLRRIRFERLLKTQKLKDVAGKMPQAGGVDAITVDPEEYDEYLKKAYKNADFDRPKNFLGFLKSIPPEEMEKLLYDHIIVTDGDLRRLAGQRAAMIKGMLVEKGPVEPERIFLVEPEAGREKKSDEKKGMQVDLLLR
ncbi:MAG: DUF748 domain-containing protein [Pseudomonadota bacterium]